MTAARAPSGHARPNTSPLSTWLAPHRHLRPLPARLKLKLFRRQQRDMTAPAEWDWQSQSQSTSSTSTRRAPAQKAPAPVCDDWEEDDGDDAAEPPAPADNQRIWDTANAQAPMPALIVSGAAPPPAAFQPAMRILKRPAAPARAPVRPAAPEETLEAREGRYREARERIFGKEADKERDGEREREREKKRGGARTPRGPQPGAAQAGFKARSARAPPPSPTPTPTLARDPQAGAAE
ncbi:hypothetical protein FB451DRAFT_1396827 [Mycena latifolia]|nr:hypothetical protein FB451DRAFT_1396827 [Mycena latifolia]